MAPRRISLSAWLLMFGSLLPAGVAAASAPAGSGTFGEALPRLSVTSFNIRFYGLNGDADGALGSETRDEHLRTFLQEKGALSDVLALQEIVDVSRLTANVLENRYNCATYDHADRYHQHVVLCVKKPLRLAIPTGDDNLVLEEVAVNNPRLRPAVHGVVVDSAGQKRLHVITVHLKAGVGYSETRDQQVEAIATYVAGRPKDLPVAVIGDFNTHGSDTAAFDAIFRRAGTEIREVRNPAPFTFRVPDTGYKFDRIWLSPAGNSPAPQIEVKGLCPETAPTTAAIKRFNEEISDHCPVVVTMRP